MLSIYLFFHLAICLLVTDVYLIFKKSVPTVDSLKTLEKDSNQAKKYRDSHGNKHLKRSRLAERLNYMKELEFTLGRTN